MTAVPVLSDVFREVMAAVATPVGAAFGVIVLGGVRGAGVAPGAPLTYQAQAFGTHAPVHG